MTRKSVAGSAAPREPMSPAGPMSHAAPALGCGAALVLLAVLGGCSGGGAATTVNPVTTPPNSTANAYTGPAPGNADVQAFKINLWEDIRAARLPRPRVRSAPHTAPPPTAQHPPYPSSHNSGADPAAQQKMNRARPDPSRFHIRLSQEFPCGWATPS